MKYKKITEKQHKELGQVLRRFRNDLCDFPKVPQSSTAYRLKRKLWKAVEELRNHLDNVVCKDYPGNPDNCRYYYGGKLLNEGGKK